MSCMTTVPASVSTAPPDMVCIGNGISTCCALGHRNTVATNTTTPMIASSPTTTFAAVSLMAIGPEWS